MLDLPLETTPADVKRRLDSGENVALVDVREPFEFAQARLDNSELIPMGSVPAALQQLEVKAEQATLVVYCHHGMRSLQVAHWLRQQGIEACQSMAGGIDRWSLEVDPTVPRYF